MALPIAGGGRSRSQGDLISKRMSKITLDLMRRFGVQVKRAGWSR